MECELCGEWETYGVKYDGDKVNLTVNVTLPFLKTGTKFKAYALQSTTLGTGQPSSKFHFKTFVKRKFYLKC